MSYHFFRYNQLQLQLGLMHTMHFHLKCFFKTGESVIVIQRAFCAYFMLCWNDAVLDRKSIMLWIENSIWNSKCMGPSHDCN